ncbi:CHC2 zinc finger domain-containing protein (plasmid) [Clostridium baratii]
MRNYKKKTSEERKKEVDLLIENAEKQIEKYFDTPEQIKELSEFMSKFYNYSIRNSILINKQFLGAVAVGSYAFWQSKGFQVNKGEKGIKILVPTKLGDRFINEKGELTLLSKANEREKNLLNKGELEVLKGKIVFKQGYVFDISQTNAKSSDLPKIFPNKWLDGEVKDYKAMYDGLKKIAENNGVKIIKPKSELGVAKGASYTLTKEIALNPRNTEIHNVKTLLHELAHAKIHDLENNHKYTKNEKEFQAELTAYTVSKYFGIDTSEYSFRYIKAWTKDIELKDKIKLIEEVRETSKEFIETLEDTLIKEKTNEKNVEHEENLYVNSNKLNKNNYEKEIYYNKNLYEEKEKDTMNLREVFNNLKERVMSKVNEIIGQDNQNIDVEKELREIEEEFTEAEKKYLDLDNTRSLSNEVYESLEDNENEIKEYGYDELKEIFKNEMGKYRFSEQISEEFFDYTFDVEKINSAINKSGFKYVKQNMISACLYSDSISEDGEKVSYSDVVLTSKDIVKDNIIELVENKNLSYDEVIELVSLENERHKDIEELTLDDIGIKTPVVDRYDREQFLKFDINDLMKKYSDEISDNRQKFMEKRGLQLRGFVEEFLQTIKEYEFVDEEDYLNISFERFLDEEIEGYALMEHEEFEEETYMDRWERQSLGEEEYLKTYGKNNAIDSYVPYYVRAYTVYENIDKDKLYEVSNDITLNNKKFESGEVFNIDSYKQGRFIIEFTNRNIKENISFSELQSISNGLRIRINEILELEKYFNEKNIDKELRKELNKNEKFIELLDKKLHLENNIINLKEDIKYYSNESQYNSIDELKEELKLTEELSSFISKEINLVVGSEIEEVKHKEKEYIIKSDIKLEDGSFIKKGTSFFIEEFKEDTFKVHFENREGNIYINNTGTGEGYYFSETEILRYSDLNKTRDLIEEKVRGSEENSIISEFTAPKNEKELQEIYKEWRKGVEIEGIPFKWLGDEKNINDFSEFANLDKPVDFKTMIDLESNLDLENVKEFEVGKIYKTNANYNLEDGSFVKKGTNFYVISKKQYGYNIKFEDNRGCKFENSSRKYYIDELDLEVFANPEKPINREYNKSNKKDLEKSNPKDYDYKKVNYYDVNRLKELPIKEVCEQLGLELKRGSNNKLWTKIRNEKSSSCCINLDKNYWYDFGLGLGGDTIKLVQEVRGITPKEAIKELATMFGIEGENVKNNFYLSKDDYKLIGIEPDRATLNLDINLEKQSIEEIKEIEKIYGRSMNELANYDKNKFLEIIKEKSLPVLIENVALLEGNLNKYKDLFKEKDEPDLEVYLYKKGLDDLDGAITKKASILKNIGLEKECDEIMKYKSKFEKDIKKYMKENSLENVFVEVKNSEVKEIKQGIYKFKDINRELEIKEAIVRKIRADEYFPMLNLNLKVDTLENKVDFNVDFKVGDGKTSDLIEEIKLLENENAINFIKEYDRELRNIGHSKSQKEVIEKIEKHEEWLRTHGKSGECLDLSYKNLEGIEIRNKDLRHSNFKNCTMSNCVIYADLTNANLKNIELKNTKFIGSKLNGVKINPTTLDIINTQISEEENKHYKAKENLKTNKVEEKSLKIKL